MKSKAHDEYAHPCRCDGCVRQRISQRPPGVASGSVKVHAFAAGKEEEKA